MDSYKYDYLKYLEDDDENNVKSAVKNIAKKDKMLKMSPLGIIFYIITGLLGLIFIIVSLSKGLTSTYMLTFTKPIWYGLFLNGYFLLFVIFPLFSMEVMEFKEYNGHSHIIFLIFEFIFVAGYIALAALCFVNRTTAWNKNWAIEIGFLFTYRWFLPFIAAGIWVISLIIVINEACLNAVLFFTIGILPLLIAGVALGITLLFLILIALIRKIFAYIIIGILALVVLSIISIIFSTPTYYIVKK